MSLYQVDELNRVLKQARSRGPFVIRSFHSSVHVPWLGVNVRGMVVINPGNPTGQCLPETNMREVFIQLLAVCVCYPLSANV